jgi:hypothetical protein
VQKILQDGVPLKGKRRKFMITCPNTRIVQMKLHPSFFDPINKISITNEMVGIKNEIIELAPRLKWYQYAWMALPIAIAIDQGLLSKIVGITTVRVNFEIFRSERSSFQKYLHTGALSFLAAATYISIIWWMIHHFGIH